MTNKFLLFISLLLLGHIQAKAQERFFKADLHFGFNFTQVDGDRLGGYHKLGLMGGIGIGHDFNEKYSGKFEINYSQKGSKTKVNPKDPNPNITKLIFDYIEIPLLVQYNKGRVYGLLGPSVGINVRNVRDDLTSTKAVDLHPTEYALHAIVGTHITERLLVEGRYSYSLLRIGDDFDNGLNIFNRVGLFNRLFSLNLAFNLGS